MLLYTQIEQTGIDDRGKQSEFDSHNTFGLPIDSWLHGNPFGIGQGACSMSLNYGKKFFLFFSSSTKVGRAC